MLVSHRIGGTIKPQREPAIATCCGFFIWKDSILTKKGSRNGSSTLGGYKFINVPLSSDDKSRLEDMLAQRSFPIDQILDLVQQGYKVSLSHDSKNSSFICSITDSDENSPAYKCILTGRGSSALNAWYAVCYRHMVLLKGDWTSNVPDDNATPSLFGWYTSTTDTRYALRAVLTAFWRFFIAIM